MILINKYDINYENTEQIESFCQNNNLEILNKIPFDNSFTQAMVQGKTIVEYKNSGLIENIKKVWEKIEQRLKR